MSKHTIPHIAKQNGHLVLMVEDKPFILLAGEVHNSDSSSPAYMEHIWEIADHLGMNTLLLPVTWEMIEPEEGSFDFSVPQALIDQARERAMKIVFLWFGSWKNAECMYAPAWVKQDLRRFPRAQIVKGKKQSWTAGFADDPREDALYHSVLSRHRYHEGRRESFCLFHGLSEGL